MPLVALLGVGAAAILAKRQAPWIPWIYLAALLGGAIALASVYWWRSGPRRWRIVGATGATALLLALLPVPWLTVRGADPPGTAWRLDGRVTVDGDTIDPPGEWYWLTVGRPPLVGEVVNAWVTGADGPIDLRHGDDASRPQASEPAAVAVGLRAAGQPRLAEDLDVAVGGRLAATPIGDWYRSLALGRSHGLMVSLVTYAHASGEDLSRGRAIAGTGAIEPDGTVSRIGGLPSKARAAATAGADVLLFPAEQVDELDGFDPGTMELIPVANLDDAIDALG
ncbi:MAG: hypothetical protein U5K29_09220 [Acidimicrobiales bacterium]|nr:hypothetical protein [Acidimicrobiales bacterium]